MATKTTYTSIEQLEAAIAATTNEFKKKDLKEKLSWMKAAEKGNFVTREHLSEYRTLIIWKIQRSLYFNNNDNLKKVMNILLARVENKEIVFRSEKGIKGLLMDAVIYASQKVCTDELTAQEGDEIWANSSLRAEGTPYACMQSFYLNLKMGN